MRGVNRFFLLEWTSCHHVSEYHRERRFKNQILSHFEFFFLFVNIKVWLLFALYTFKQRVLCCCTFSAKPPDPCKTINCSAPYSLGCRVVNDTAECICPDCPDTVSPVCTSDDVQDRSECLMKRQSCITGDLVTVAKSGPCGKWNWYVTRTSAQTFKR